MISIPSQQFASKTSIRDLFQGHNNEVKVSSKAKGLCESCCLPKQSRDLRFIVFNKERRSGVVISPQLKPGAAARAGVKPNVLTVIFVHGFSETSPGHSGKTIVDGKTSISFILIKQTDNFRITQTIDFRSFGKTTPTFLILLYFYLNSISQRI